MIAAMRLRKNSDHISNFFSLRFLEFLFQLGEVYAEAGVCNAQIAAEEKKFVCSSRDAVCRPFERRDTIIKS